MNNHQLTPMTRMDIEIRAYAEEIDIENQKRLSSTSFGYRFGGIIGLGLTSVVLLLMTAVCIIAVVGATPSTGYTMVPNPIVLSFTPVALIPVMPFVFLKLKYAFMAVGAELLFLVFLVVMSQVLHFILEAALNGVR